MLYRDTDGRIRHKGISKDRDDFYAYDGSEYDEEVDESLCDSCINGCKDDFMIVDACSSYKAKS